MQNNHFLSRVVKYTDEIYACAHTPRPPRVCITKKRCAQNTNDVVIFAGMYYIILYDTGSR